MNLPTLYEDAILARAADLDMRNPDEWPPLPLILNRCADRLVALIALFNEPGMGSGWDEDVQALTEMSARWVQLADALDVIERREAAH